MLKIMGKKILTIAHSKICLSKPRCFLQLAQNGNLDLIDRSLNKKVENVPSKVRFLNQSHL